MIRVVLIFVVGLILAAAVLHLAPRWIAKASPADAQAIQDAPYIGRARVPQRDLGMEPPCLLTPGEHEAFADLTTQLGDTHDWERLAGLYLIPEETS